MILVISSNALKSFFERTYVHYKLDTAYKHSYNQGSLEHEGEFEIFCSNYLFYKWEIQRPEREMIKKRETVN